MCLRGKEALKDYEKYFVAKTAPLCRAGVSFQDLAREALSAKFGGAAEVLFRGLSPDALVDPSHFAIEMSHTFGRGAMGFLEPIEKYVDMGLYASQSSSPVLDLIRTLGTTPGSVEGGSSIPLHDHRVKDEDGNYPDNAS